MKNLTKKQEEALAAIRACNGHALNAADVAPLLEQDPQCIRSAAQAGTTGYPVSIVGNKVIIPRIPFLRFWGYEP